MFTTRKNLSVKAIQSAMAKAKKVSRQAQLEYELSCASNPNRYHCYDQWEINDLYSRDSYKAAEGASKTCHLISHEGNKFVYIVIKRHQTHGYIPNVKGEHKKCTGNQLIDEINCWVEFQERPEADLLCPILKYFTSKSDKVTATSETMQENVVIVAQRAVKVGSAWAMCQKAEEMNRENGCKGETAVTRYEKLKAMSRARGWRDAMNNPGNSGVIFDYSQNRYKAVFIDYAL